PEAAEAHMGSDGSQRTKECFCCHTRSTPVWRRDPRTHHPLCNACGVYLSTRQQLRPQSLIDIDTGEGPDVAESAESARPQCSNCGTRKTSTWRRNKGGEQMCNACGVYERVNGSPRPLALRVDRIRPRAK
ncbi:hypothetical protein B0H19DRAFT_905535, partial [Mycena capillaripes]